MLIHVCLKSPIRSCRTEKVSSFSIWQYGCLHNDDVYATHSNTSMYRIIWNFKCKNFPQTPRNYLKIHCGMQNKCVHVGVGVFSEYYICSLAMSHCSMFNVLFTKFRSRGTACCKLYLIYSNAIHQFEWDRYTRHLYVGIPCLMRKKPITFNIIILSPRYFCVCIFYFLHSYS